MVEEWAEYHWVEGFVVFTCDHKVLVKQLFDLLDFSELEFVVSVALVEM